MQNKLVVVIGADCDPDRLTYKEKNYKADEWRGVKEGIPELKRYLAGIQNLFNDKINLTWCVRCDFQIKEIYGKPGWCLKEFSSLWKELEREGDEISWHLHFWRWDPIRQKWYQEIEDKEWMKRCIQESFRSYGEVWGGTPLSIRTGWVFHNNTTMKEISDSGVKIDFSAIPGLTKMSISHRNILDYADWQGTPLYPYHPSLQDYRLPALTRENSLPIWELPCLVLRSNFLKWPYNIKSLVSGKNNILVKPVFPAMITSLPFLFKRSLQQWLEMSRSKKEVFLVTYFHPDELFSSRRKYFIENLFYIQKLASKQEREIYFLTASESLGWLNNFPEGSESINARR